MRVKNKSFALLLLTIRKDKSFMNDSTFAKRALSVAVAAATILWAVGAAAFAVPTTASAADAGDVVRSTSLSTVYFVGYDGARYAFPNEKTYDTWFDGFGSVETISDADVAGMTLAGNVVYRPGSRWIKITSAAETYAVGRDGMIYWIETEDVATDLAGSDWNQNIDDVSDSLFTDYSEGVSLSSATVWDGALYMDGSDYMLSWDGEARTVTAAGRSANDLEDGFFLDGDSIDASSLSAGSDLDGADCDVSDASQTDCVVTSAGGDVTVSTSSSTAAGATIPGGATSVEVFSFDLTAADAANVNGVTLDFNGIAAVSNISNVYLYEGMTRLTESRSVNSSTREVTFGSLDLDIAAGATRTITARVEIATAQTAGDEFYFSIDGANAEADGTVSGSATGETFTMGAQDVGTVTVSNNGTVTNPSLGEDDAKIAQFQVAPSGEDVDLEELTLKIDNAADHSDFKLWTLSNELVGTGEYIGDKLVSFDVDGVDTIEDGDNDIFKVTADIGGESGDTVDPYLDNTVDVLAVGTDYGFGNAITNSYASASQSTTIQGGNVTFTFSGPSAGDILVDSQDQVLLEFTLTSAEDITVKDLDVIVYADDDADNDATDGTDSSDSDNDGLINTGDEANLKDIRIINADTGKTLMGPLELDCTADNTACSATGSSTQGDGSQTIDFTDDFGVDAGEVLRLQVTGDIDDTVTSGTEFAATIDISGFVAEDTNGDNLTLATDVVPTGDIIGNNQEALSASLTLTLGSTPGDVTTVHGTSDVVVNRFNLQAGDAGTIDVSQIVVSVYSDDTVASGAYTLGDHTTAPDVNDYVSSCTIYDVDDNLLDGPTSPAANGQTITFDDVDWTIEASENEEIEVRCDFHNPSSTTEYYFAWDINDASEDIVAQDEEGTDVDPTADDPNGATNPTNIVTVAASGSLALTQDSSAPAADFVLTGTNDNHVSAFRLDATNESFEVTRFTLTEEEAEDMGLGTDATDYVNNISSMTIEYPMEDGSTGTASASISTNEAIFTGLEMYVEEGEAAVVDVYVDVPATDRTGSGSATSNERISIGWDADTTNNNHIIANGVGSGFQLTDTDNDGSGTNFSDVVSGNAFVVRETAPTITLNSSSPSGTGFVPGDQEVIRFNVSASSNESVVWEEMVFDVAATDNTGTPTQWDHCDDGDTTNGFIAESQFDLYNLSDAGLTTALDTADGDWTLYSTEGGTLDICDETADTNAGEVVTHAKITLPTAETVPAGETYIYSLYYDSQYASAANDDSVQFGIASDPIVAVTSAEAMTDVDEGGGVTATDTNFTLTSGTGISRGDILCLDDEDVAGCDTADELALVTYITGAEVYLVRGYLGTTPAALVDADDVDMVPASFVWRDDGSTTALTTTSMDEYWGSYLVDSLPIDGGAMGF